MADVVSTSTEDTTPSKRPRDFQIPEKYRTPLKVAACLLVFLIIVVLVWVGEWPSLLHRRSELSNRASQLGHRTYEDQCVRKTFGEDSFVCVCNSTFCDEIAGLGLIQRNEAVLYVTSAAEARLRRIWRRFDTADSEGKKVWIDLTNQSALGMVGFGSTLTDASYQNIVKNPNMTQQILRQFFGPHSIHLSVLRVPIGATEYSTQLYTLDDKKDDFGLNEFSLQNDKKQIVDSSPQTKPWAFSNSAPGWMKKSGSLEGNAPLVGTSDDIFYNIYAQYLVKYLEQVHKFGVKFWALSPLHQPLTSMESNETDAWPGMGMDAKEQAVFINSLLGPNIKAHPAIRNVLVFGHNDFADKISETVPPLFESASFADGLAILNNMSAETDLHDLRKVQEKLFNRMFLSVEVGDRQRVAQGRWQYAAEYASSIIAHLNQGFVGWVDSNLALNERGGPALSFKSGVAPVIVSHESAEFFKQPSYYIQGHFSKFIPHGSHILSVQVADLGSDPIEVVAALTPNLNVVLVVHNKDTEREHRLVVDASTHKTPRFLPIKLAPKSIQTIVWRLEAE